MRNKKYLLRRKGFSVKKALLSIGVVASIGLAFSHSTDILESALANSATENVEKTQTNNVLSHPVVQKEQNAALDALINRWQEKSPEEIKEELLRQEEAGSIAYVVQWGDTLPNIASAAGLTVDELLDLGRFTSDQDERLAYYYEAQEIIHDEVPWVFLQTRENVTGIRNSVKGFEHHPTGSYFLENVTID